MKTFDTETLKASVIKEVDANRSQLKELGLKIHSKPELGFQEVKAAAWLTQYLEQNGFTVERGISELPTAFKASYGHGKPTIAIMAEYDALPNLGHACGHNLIAASAVGAGVASKLAVDHCGGTILVIGTPAEEIYGGKVTMADRGAFDNLDAAMLVHPGQYNSALFYTFAAQALSPNMAPPLIGLLGSTAIIPTDSPLLLMVAVNLSTRVLFPPPGGPVIPIQYAVPRCGWSTFIISGRCGLSFSAKEISCERDFFCPASISLINFVSLAVSNSRHTPRGILNLSLTK